MHPVPCLAGLPCNLGVIALEHCIVQNWVREMQLIIRAIFRNVSSTCLLLVSPAVPILTPISEAGCSGGGVEA